MSRKRHSQTGVGFGWCNYSHITGSGLRKYWEIRYLRQFDSKERKEILERIFSFDIPCIIVTNDNKIPEELIKIAEEKNVSVFKHLILLQDYHIS
ncbi:MAG: hypothetical protein R3A12_08675 [Ignavibacteria bacterium]